MKKKIAILNYLISLICIGLGLHKMFVYENYDSVALTEDNVNAYVGGDAYNYIINTGYANAYFILALIFIIIGCSMLVLDKLEQKNNLLNSVNERLAINVCKKHDSII